MRRSGVRKPSGVTTNSSLRARLSDDDDESGEVSLNEATDGAIRGDALVLRHFARHDARTRHDGGVMDLPARWTAGLTLARPRCAREYISVHSLLSFVGF